MIAGTLEIQLLANMARLQADMEAAKNSVGNAMKSIETAVGYAKAALVSFIGITSVNAFKGMVQGSIEATAGLHDMAMQTGASVAALAAFRSVASTSETSIDGIAGAMNKMAKAMAGADEDSKRMGQAVKAIGLNFNDLRNMKPDEQMLAVAKALDGFQDGAGKSAVAMTLFGKEGAKMLPFLKDLADESDAVAAKMTEQQVTAKAAQAAMADDYADNLTKIKKASDGWKKDVSMALLPALFEASQAFRDVTTGAGGVKDGISKLSADGSITNWARMAITGVTYVMDVFEGLKAVVTSVGHVIGGYAALIGEQWGATGTVIAKIIKGDFAGATSEVAASFERQKSIVKDLGTTLDATWGAQTFGSKLRDRMEQLQGVAAVAKVAKENLKFEASGDSSKKDAAEKVSDYQKLTRVIAEKQAADNLQLVTGSLLTESDKIRAKMQADLSTGAIKLTAGEIALTEAGLKKLAATELQIAAEKFYVEQGKKRFEASSALIKSAVDEAEKNEILARTFGMTREAIEQSEIAALEAQLTQKTTIGLCTAETAELEALIDAKKRNSVAVASVDSQKARDEVNKKLLEEQQKTVEKYDDIFRTGFSGMLNNGKDAWSAFSTSLVTTFKTSVADQIYKMFAQPFVIKMVGSMAGMIGMSGFSGSAAAGQGGTNAMTSLSTVQSLKSLFDTASGGLNIGAKLGQYLVDKVGNQLVGDFAAGMTNVGSIQSASMAAQAGGAQLAGVIAGSVLNGVSGYGISKALSGGYSIDGFNVNAIAGIASMIPGIGPIAGVIGGLVNRAFGQGATEVRAQGTEGTFSGSGFSGNNYAQLHRDGGLFSSDSDWKTTSALADSTAKAWGSAFTGVKVSVAGMATSLGLSADSITSYSKRIDLAAGSSAETITAMFTGMADDMATALAPGLSQLAKEGETSSVTLSRLGTSLTTTNSWLSILRQRLFGVSLAGGDAASKLADAFGGLDALTASAKSFYETYYTEGERSARSMEDMTKALSLVGLTLPDSKDALKALAGTLDLTTDSGRTAYAVLLAIAPEYAATADTLAKLSKETADKLMATFTGGGLLVPALDAAQLHVGDLAGGVQVLTGDLSFINKIMGDASSGVISFGSGVVQLDTGLSQSQLSAGLLTGQMDALRDRADKTRIDFDGLSIALFGVKTGTVASQIDAVNAYLRGVQALPVGTSIADANAYLAGVKALPVGASMESVNAYLRGVQALPVGTSIADANAYLASIKALPVGAAIDAVNASLNGINTGTFVSTIEAVFANLATRISSVIGDISAERTATVSAALQIINPTVMSKAQIERGISAINVNLPSNSAVVSANAAMSAKTLAALDAQKLATERSTALSQAGDALAAAKAVTAALPATFDAARSQLYSSAHAKGIGLNTNELQGGAFSSNSTAYSYNAQTNRLRGWDYVSTWDSGASKTGALWSEQAANIAKLAGANAQLIASEGLIASAQSALVSAGVALKDATDAIPAALTAKANAEAVASVAALAYAAAMQGFIIDAGKSVGKLTKLREETVKYYDAQKALATLMTTSATNIRSTVTAYTFSQKTDEQKYQDLAGQFSTAYSMSKITTGETLAGYGDKINALINPMIDALSATGRDSLIANYLAQAEAVALSVDSGVVSLGDYQADSLSMLGSIDATLAALDTSSQSAERIISDAVKAGSDKTAAGLHAVVAALTGQAIPAFASGGAFTNGVVSRPTMFNMGLMGEAGDEGILPLANVGGRLGVHARLGGGGGGGNTARLEALVERQAQQLEAITRELVALRREAAATASSNEKMVRQGDRLEVVGMPVRNAPGAALETVVAA